MCDVDRLGDDTGIAVPLAGDEEVTQNLENPRVENV